MNRVGKVVIRAGLGAVALLAVVYIGDYAVLKYRISLVQRSGDSPANASNSPGSPLESVQVEQTYQIPHKDGRAEYDFAPPETVTCANSIFPHLGYSPCWYLKRHSRQTIPM